MTIFIRLKQTAGPSVPPLESGLTDTITNYCMATANVGNLPELWRPINFFEDAYLISSLGRIKSIARSFPTGRSLKRIAHKPETISISTVGKDGYCRICLKCKPAKMTFLVHRLVAIHFLPNPHNLETVNHINGNKQDNRIENLEWSSQQDNNLHKYRVLGYKGSSAGKFGSDHHEILAREPPSFKRGRNCA